MHDGGPAAEQNLVEVTQDGPVAALRLNRPKALNALSTALIARITEVLDAVAEDRGVRVVILRGDKRAFCAGHDLAEMTAMRQAPDGGRAAFEALFSQCAAMMTRLNRLPQPVIAEVRGIATAAGCQLAASCDVVYAAEDARFGVNGVDIGLFCSTPMVALSRNVGRKRAFEMLSTGRFLTAAEAVEAGLATAAVTGDQLEERVQACAAQLAAKPPVALRYGKRAFYEQAEMPVDQAYAFTGRVIAENMMATDTMEGIAAFLEKRAPRWRED